MPDNDNEYPPQFASSDLSSLLGQINDFAGVEPPPPPPPTESMALKSKAAVRGPAASLLSDGTGPVPVTIVGSAAQRGPYLPGLRDELIGVTILRLSEQIVATEQKAAAQKLAYELIALGSAQVGEFARKTNAAAARRAKAK